ncbi:uncharacterized protein DS421_13g399770 [Arachis hypogaea]|nr:uncharacterized protein DS421_13g399770 [Arachis hypogaea]
MEKKESWKICKRCKETYDPSSNTTSSCRFHPSFFVCRRHDDQKRNMIVSSHAMIFYIWDHCSFKFRYYELGPNDPPYAAKFYDCCGAEDPEASGCTTNFHVSYDDD